MEDLGGSIVVLCAWLAGRALLPSREHLPRDGWEEQSVAYLLGASALVLASMAATAAGLLFSAWLAWAILAAAAAAGVLRLLRERGSGLAAPAWPVWQRVVVVVLGGGAALLTVAFPLNSFDPLLHFALKAKALYFGGDPLGPAFTDIVGEAGTNHFGRIMTHPNYPLGVPFLEALSAHAGFGWSERWVQLPLAPWVLCIPGAVSLALRGRGAAAQRWAALVAVAVPMLYVRKFLGMSEDAYSRAGFSGTMSLGGSDLALTALFLGGLALLLRARAAPCRRTAVCAGVCMAGTAMMKNEGLALIGVTGLALLVGAPLAGAARWKPTLLALGSAVLLVAPWLVVRAQLPAIDENYADRLTPASVVEHWNGPEKVEKSRSARLGEDAEILTNPPLRREILQRVYENRLFTWVSLRNWGLLWLLALLSLPLGAAWRDQEARWMAAILLGGHLLYFLVLLVTPWYLNTLTNTGIPERIWMHLIGPAALLIGLRWSGPPKLNP